MQFHHQYRAPPPPRSVRQFTQLGMPLSRVFRDWLGRTNCPLPPRSPLQPTSPRFKTDLHCAYHQRAGHDTDSCSALRHAIQDLIDQGLVDLGRPGVATDPLPTHDTRAVPPPPEGVHLIEFAGNEIFMMGWDGEAPQPISLYEESDFVGYIPRQQIPRPFSLTPDKIYGPPLVSPIVTRSGRVAQPPPVDRPFAGIAAREEVQREDDEILRQLRTTQARIFIWSLLASSSTHRDALVRALGQIRVDTATTPKGLFTSDFRASTQTVRAYDGTQRTVMGTLSTHVMIGAMLHISHSENDLHLTGFMFDEVQVVSLEDGNRDMVPMSFDQHSNTLVLNMMRGMSYLLGMGLGHRQQGPHEFTFAVDHDTPYGLGYIPIEADASYMARLRRDRVRARMTGIPFDYPLHPYTFQLADYFIRGSEHTPCIEGTVHIPETIEIQDIQQALGQIHLDTGTTETPGAMIVAPPSPDRASVFSMCFPRGGP
ncbi:hypothetical protein CK203_019586 [Vitis vinifera]|uniref:Uncharacterized protein n=1 Tax=Vitis vinifera TaxID=29760 RepID=A0A438JQZ7_VITVI|nr:hypothetical protein CK203_019586 [Vitis vinifera]